MNEKSLEEINVKLLLLDSLLNAVEDQLCSAGAEHMSDALGRGTDLFYILWSQLQEITEAVNKLTHYAVLGNAVQASARIKELEMELYELRPE